MPPKKRGHNARGREKIFRNAVQHVHVGVGYNALGNINLQLAAGPVARGGDDTLEECAFLMELNELMLSHSTTDFKQFRWEVLELCESKALFRLNHRKIAEKLLLCLMRRDKFAEGFEAFVRLTVAFARDTREKFLAYFECFHQAINGGIFDAKGQLLADTRRLQLVFAAQVAWCREMRPYWLLLDQRKLVERIVRLYVRKMHDRKEYIRRLSAEVLAFLCRTVRELVPFVLEEACMDVVRDFQSYCASSARSSQVKSLLLNEGDVTETGDDSGDAGEQDEDMEEKEKEEEEEDVSGDLTAGLESMALLQTYEQNRLPMLPVVDGMSFLAAELFRGIRGALSTNFENYYVLFLFVFGLSRRTQFSGTHCTGEGTNEREMFGFTEEEAQHFVHASQWKETFTGVLNRREGEATSDDVGVDDKNTHRRQDEETVRRCAVMRELLQMIGAVTVGGALRMVAEEVAGSRHLTGGVLPAGDNAGSSDQDDEEDGKETQEAARASSLQLLKVMTALLEFSVPHAQLLLSLLHATNCKFFRDPAATPLLRQVANTLRTHMTEQRKALLVNTSNVDMVGDWTRFLRACGVVLEALTPLCVDESTSVLHVSKPQRLFLPLSNEIVTVCLSVSDLLKNAASCGADKGLLHTQEATRLMLFAFVQDVLQKNYAFCLRDERYMNETETETHRTGRVVKSHLTPFAFSFLVPLLRDACSAANMAMGFDSPVCGDDNLPRGRSERMKSHSSIGEDRKSVV